MPVQSADPAHSPDKSGCRWIETWCSERSSPASTQSLDTLPRISAAAYLVSGWEDSRRPQGRDLASARQDARCPSFPPPRHTYPDHDALRLVGRRWRARRGHGRRRTSTRRVARGAAHARRPTKDPLWGTDSRGWGIRGPRLDLRSRTAAPTPGLISGAGPLLRWSASRCRTPSWRRCTRHSRAWGPTRARTSRRRPRRRGTSAECPDAPAC